MQPDYKLILKIYRNFEHWEFKISRFYISTTFYTKHTHTHTHTQKETKNNVEVKYLKRAFFSKRKRRITIPTPHPGLGVLSRQLEVSALKGIHFRGSVLKFLTVGEPRVTDPCSK